MEDEEEMIRKWERKFSQRRKRARDMASFPAVRRERRGKGEGAERKEGKREREVGGRERGGSKWPFVMT